MNKIYKIIYIVFVIIFIKLLITFGLNEYFISQYNNKEYNESIVEKLLFLNIYQPYIAHYNYGNVLYNNGKYNQAIEEYKRALNLFPPQYKECPIRINLALSILKGLHTEPKNDNDINEDISILEEAKHILCEKGCAHEDDNNGHNRQAQRLKNDIDKRIQELEQMKEQASEGEKEEEDEENNSQEENKENVEEIKEELEEIKEQVMEERREEMESTIQLQNWEYYDGKTW